MNDTQKGCLKSCLGCFGIVLIVFVALALGIWMGRYSRQGDINTAAQRVVAAEEVMDAYESVIDEMNSAGDLPAKYRDAFDDIEEEYDR